MDSRQILIQAAHDAIVSIEIDDTFVGSGVVMGCNRVLTCAHVTRRAASTFKLSTHSGASVTLNADLCQFAYGAEDLDYVLLKAPEPMPFAPLRLSPDAPRPGEDVLAGGFAMGLDGPRLELFPNVVGDYDPIRKRVMLQDASAQGFSGAAALALRGGSPVVLGLLTSNRKAEPKRAFMVQSEVIAWHFPDLVQEEKFTNAWIGALQQDSKYLRRGFIDLGATDLTDDSRYQSCVDALGERLLSDRSARVLLLGQYGSGKSTVALELASRLQGITSGNMLIHRMDLKNSSEMPDWNTVERSVNTSTRWSGDGSLSELVKAGLFVLILDGLDELQSGLTRVEASKMVRSLPSRYPEGVRLLVTARLTLFFEYERLVDALVNVNRSMASLLFADRATRESLSGVLLEEPTWPQIKAYVTASSADPDDAIAFIESTYNLRELANRPVLLEMIVDCLPQIRELEAQGRRVNSADLYLAYVEEWLGHEKRKTSIPHREITAFMCALAVCLFVSKEPSLGIAGLADLVREVVASVHVLMDVDAISRELGGCTFLDLGPQGYSFSHRSFMEFFVAMSIVDSLENSVVETERLITEVLSGGSSQNEVLDFLRDMIVVRWGEPLGASALLLLKSQSRSVRSHTAHLLGHVGASHSLEIDKISVELVGLLSRTDDDWVIRSAYLALGRIGQWREFQYYIDEVLPSAGGRTINLSYHLEYYGSALGAVSAILGHFSRGLTFIAPVDVFTLRQVVALETPLTERDQGVAEALVEMLGEELMSGDPARVADVVAKQGVDAMIVAILDRYRE